MRLIDPVFIRFYPYFKKHLKWIVLSLLASIVFSGTEALFPWCLKLVTDKFLVRKETSDLLLIMGGLIMVMLISHLFQFLQKHFSTKVKMNLSIHLRIILFKSLFFKKMEYFHNKHTGETLSLINNDLPIIENLPDLLVRVYFEFPIRIAIMFCTMLFLDYKLTLLGVCIAPPTYIIMKVLKKYRKKLSMQRLTILEAIFSDFSEFLEGIKVIKGWSLLEYSSRKLERDYVKWRRISLNEVKYNSIMKASQALVVVLLINIMLYVAVSGITKEGATAGDYTGFMLAFWLFIKPIQRMAMGYSSLVNAGVAGHRVLEVFENQEKDEVNPVKGRKIEKISKIEIQNAGYTFTDKKILEEVNMSFEISKVYTITGPNGSGKTTITESLAGFTTPSSGKILFNGRPMEEYSLDSLRSRMSFVWQDISLFNNSVRENIVFESKIKDDEAKRCYDEALNTARIHEILNNRERDDTCLISEKGENFSAGEKQRICIARALFKEHDIIILDEANSNISKEVYKDIFETICKEKEGKIIISISHEPAYWSYSDVIYDIVDGKVMKKQNQKMYKI